MNQTENKAGEEACADTVQQETTRQETSVRDETAAVRGRHWWRYGQKFYHNCYPLWQPLQQRFALLHRAQWCYLIAVLSFVLMWFGMLPPMAALVIFTVSSMVAFTLDAWPQLEKFWHSLYGKALMVFIYAIFLNLILAMAEASVNNFTGVKPDTMRYTVNLIALMLAPAFLIGGTAMLMLLYMLLHLAKIMLFLLLRPIGLRSTRFFDGEAYPITTLVLRIFLLPITCVMMMELTQAYLQRNDFNTSLSVGPEGQQQSIRQIFSQSAVLTSANATDSTASTWHWYELLAAEFLYQVESQGKSVCQLHDQEHGVPQGEHDLLVITPDSSTAIGYRFSVRPCHSPGQLQLIELWQQNAQSRNP